jgi:hypothetical protein
VVTGGTSTWSSGNNASGPSQSGPSNNGQSGNGQSGQNNNSNSSGQSGNSSAEGGVNDGGTAGANPDAPFVGNAYRTKAGERPTRDANNCDGAHDHCLPQGVLFASEWKSGRSGTALVTIKMERGLWAWVRSDIVRGDFQGMETERATTATLTVGATAIAFRMGAHWGNLPRNEADAISGQWVIGKVASIDRGSKTFRVEGEPEAIPIVAARIVKSSAPLPPEP